MKANDLDPLVKAVKELKLGQQSKIVETLSPELEERISSVEIKIRKLWDLLTQKTPKKNDTLSKYGKTFSSDLVGKRM